MVNGILLFIAIILLAVDIFKKIGGRWVEFLEGVNDKKLSSARLMGFLTVFAVLSDWQHAVYCSTDGVWRPSWQTIVFVLIVLGFKFAEKLFPPQGK